MDVITWGYAPSLPVHKSRVPTSSRNHGTWKITKKGSMHGKNIEFEEKKLNNQVKIMEFVK